MSELSRWLDAALKPFTEYRCTYVEQAPVCQGESYARTGLETDSMPTVQYKNREGTERVVWTDTPQEWYVIKPVGTRHGAQFAHQLAWHIRSSALASGCMQAIENKCPADQNSIAAQEVVALNEAVLFLYE
jgi:hypothetical protein